MTRDKTDAEAYLEETDEIYDRFLDILGVLQTAIDNGIHTNCGEQHTQELHDWLSEAVDRYITAQCWTLDEAFGATDLRKGKHRANVRYRMKFGMDVFLEVRARTHAGDSLTEALGYVADARGRDKKAIRDIYNWVLAILLHSEDQFENLLDVRKK